MSKFTIDMAREAGWKDLRDYDSEMQEDFFMGNTNSLKAFEALVRTDEREACAKVCEEVLEQYRGTIMGKHAELVGDECAGAIRNRRNT